MKLNVKAILTTTIFAMIIAVFGVAVFAQQHQHGKAQCANCPMNKEGGMMQGKGMMQDSGRMQDMETIHALFADNKKIKRSVKNIANGVEATTESNDPKVKALIIEHTFAMKERLVNKQPIRIWDPLFAALFEHADKIELLVTRTEKGVKITETSNDPYVVKLIQSHAQGVTEFVKEGMAVMHKPHELPGAKPEPNKFLGKGDGVTTCPVTGEPVNKEVSAEIYGRTVYFCCPNCRDTVKKNPELYLKK
ncbi:MAG: hypothetical protein AB1757_09460 [Acidobacteriota bacterium]